MTFKECLLTEKERFPLFIPVILGCGILIGVFFPFCSLFNLLITSGFFTLTSLAIYKKAKLSSILLFVFSLGLYVSQTGGILNTDFLSQKKFLEKEYDGIRFTSTVKFIEETHPIMKNMRRIILQNVKFPDNKELNFIKTAKMTCSVKSSENIFPGDFVEVKGKITPHKPPAIPGSFDQQQYNSLIKIDTNGIIYYIKKIKGNNNFDYFSYFRRILTKNIIEKLKGNAGGIAGALLTGDKSSIPNSVREVFIKSGTAHILAISGLHMSILASLVYLIFWKLFQYLSYLFQKINPKLLAAIFTIPIIFLYLGLSGFSPSAIRAFIMTLFFMISIILERGVLSLRSVSNAAFLILIFDSASLFLVSFQLSFCAVVSLISFYEVFQVKLTELRLKYNNILWKILFYIFASFLTTIIASIATGPISVATFNRLNFSGILGNLIAIPTMSFLIVPIGLLSLITASFSDFFIKIIELILNKMTEILSFIANLPYSNITIKSPSLIILYIITSGGIMLCLLQTKLRNLGWIGIILGIGLWSLEEKPDIIISPKSETICFVENNNFYTTSLQKGRRSSLSIQRNLGYDGKLIKKAFEKNIETNTKNGLFIWSQKRVIKELTKSNHPYCPAYFKNKSKL